MALENSILVNQIIKNATARRDEIGVIDDILEDLFMVGTLELLSDEFFGMLTSEISGNEDAMAEFRAVKALLSKHTSFWDMVLFNIFTDAKSSEYRSALPAERLSLKRILSLAEAECKSRGKSKISADVIIELMLKDPTDAIKKHILNEDTQRKAPPKKDSSEIDLSEFFFGDDDDDTSDSSADDTPVEVKAPLSSLVVEAKQIKEKLLEHVFGQDHAVNTFVTGYFHAQLAHKMKKDPNKPKATFLFAGPPGTGKTFLSEMIAQTLGLPFRRFDMSEYSENEANLEFCGSDKVYKGGKEGNVTGFVAKHPRCVVLFDEIEKAHINVIHLFLQMLDAGKLRDNYTDEEVSFSEAIIICTTNAGKGLYNDLSISNLSTLPRKQVLKALGSDKGPDGNPLFPPPICSRFASGNIVMFNHLSASSLLSIAKNELEKNIEKFEIASEKPIVIDPNVFAAIMMAEGGNADARTIKGRANNFFHDELYELFRLVTPDIVDGLERISIKASLDDVDEKIRSMFINNNESEVLVFADGKLAADVQDRVKGVRLFFASSLDEAKQVLFENNISIVLCDINCKPKGIRRKLLNSEDIESEGQEFLAYVLEKHALPVYIIQGKETDISPEELFSFAKLGVRDLLTVRTKKKQAFGQLVLSLCEDAYRQTNMIKLASENKLMSFKTSQTISKDKKKAEICLFNFTLALAPDHDDSQNIMDGGIKPKVRFADVIGAEDAKGELKYFVEYLKDPVKFMKKGVRAPRGILLYGPPGTGKTLLAKAMAGESDVTFMPVDGNSFLKKYVGEGPQSVHALFNAARKYAPAIVFIDEIDAIAKDRNAVEANGVAATLTAFLTEMDGFNTDTSRPVFVLAATNFNIDPSLGLSLDPALLRRFDRKICVDLPNKDERERYLKMKLAKYPIMKISPEEVENIATRSNGMSLAELENVIEFALRNAIKTDGEIGDAEFEEAFETSNGGEKKLWSERSLEKTARHEAGHTLVNWLSGQRPSYVTIVARGDHGGYMQYNNENKGTYTKNELLDRIRCALGGRAAEIVYYGPEDGISTGASGDLISATRTAQAMICDYGMDSKIGLSAISLNNASGECSELVRSRVNEILSEQLQLAIDEIERNRTAVDAMVQVLLKKSFMKENEITELFERYSVK